MSLGVQRNGAGQLICGRNMVGCHIGRITGAVAVPRHDDSGQNRGLYPLRLGEWRGVFVLGW